MTRKISPEKRRAVEALLRTGRDQREIAKAVGISKGSVSSIKKGTRSKAAARTAPRPAPKMPKSPVQSKLDEHAARRAELIAIEDAAENSADYYDAGFAVLMHDDPQLDQYMRGGATRLDALVSAGYDEALFLHRPSDIAELAVFVTDDVKTYGPEENETPEQYVAYRAETREAARARAVKLLEAALEIVRAKAAA